MTIKEAQQLIDIIDRKTVQPPVTANVGADELCRRLRDLLREANGAGIDLTQILVDSLDDKK